MERNLSSFFCIFCDFVLLVTGNAELFSQIVSAPSRLSSSPSRLPQKPKDLRVREFDFVEKFLKFGADHCQSFDDGTLIRRLKDEGDYNPTYMAPTVEEAARRFEDLSLKPFELASNAANFCDEDCQEATDSMIVQLRALDKLPPLEDIDLKPDLSNMQPRVNGAAMSQMMFAGRNNYRRSDYASSFFGRLRGRKKRQSDNSVIDSEKGQGHAVYCWKAGEQGRNSGKNLHHICSACRSIKVLPSNYFPRYLNQVECIGGPCLNGEGVCTKQFMFVNVLKNTGTDACQRWEKAQIRLAVCCDCMLKKESRLYRRVLG